jgi:hypothetical protein
VSQLARRLNSGVHWIYDRLHNGSIALDKDAALGLYLFPDDAALLEQLQELKSGSVSMVDVTVLCNNSASEVVACVR